MIAKTGGPTVEELTRELEQWRAGRPKRDTHYCNHCGRVLKGAPTAGELMTLMACVLGGQKGAARVRGRSVNTVKETMTHLYRRIGVDDCWQAAYLLGRGDLTTEVTG